MGPDWLLVDLGNSRLKWAWFSEERRCPAEAMPHDRSQSLAPLLNDIWAAAPAPRRVLICSVASAEYNAQITHWCQNQWQLTPDWFRSSGELLGLRNAYLEPERLGNDRWLAMLAARQRLDGPLAVVDCGTALTIDLINAQGQHQGGWILPGLGLQHQALLGNTAIRQPASAWATLAPGLDTASCIANGTLLGALGALQMVARQLQDQPQWQGLRWVLGGGEASIIAPFLPWPHELLPDLLLDGLALLALHLDRSP
jgi:type III pantothenate kinase